MQEINFKDDEYTFLGTYKYMTITDNKNNTLCIDWVNDAVYFKFNDKPTIILSIGLTTLFSQTHLLTDPNEITKFKSFMFRASNNIKKISSSSQADDLKLCSLVDLYV
jgi:hypothetical protein